MVVQVLKKLLELYGPWLSIAVFSTARQWSPFWASWIHLTSVIYPALSQHPLMVAGHYLRTIRVPAVNDHICRPSCLSATWGHAVLWRGHNELHQTKRNVYINNCIFLRKTSHMKVGLIMNEALTFSLQTVELPRQQVVVSQAFSDMLSGSIRFLSGSVFTLWNSINQQMLKLAIGYKSFSTLSQVMG